MIFLKGQYKYNRTTITFDCGSKELKDKAINLARNFKPVKISLSDLCQIALREFIEKYEEKI